MHLVESVGLQDALVCRADEDLQAQLLFASVTMQLQRGKSFQFNVIIIKMQDKEWILYKKTSRDTSTYIEDMYFFKS